MSPCCQQRGNEETWLAVVDCDTAELWEILPKVANTSIPYQDFVNTVYKLYPGSDTEQCWSIADMDKLVGETSRVSILSLGNLGKYHREFIAITAFLFTKNHISTAEQSHAFTHGFPLELWGWVCHCLQLKFPDHFPDNPYNLEQIHDAMQSVLYGTALFSLTLDNIHTPALNTTPVAKDKPAIKSEKLSALINIMKQAIAKLRNQVPKLVSQSLSSLMTSTAISVEGTISKVNVMSSKSTYAMGSVYSTMMAASPH